MVFKFVPSSVLAAVAMHTRNRKLYNACLTLLLLIPILYYYSLIWYRYTAIRPNHRRRGKIEEKNNEPTTISLLTLFYSEHNGCEHSPEVFHNARDKRDGGTPQDNSVWWIFIELPSQVARHVCKLERRVCFVPSSAVYPSPY